MAKAWQKHGCYSLLWWFWRRGPVKCVGELFLAPWCHAAAQLRNPSGWSCEGRKKTTKEETQEWVELLAFQAEVTEQRLRSQVNRGEATMLLASKQWARILVRHGTLFNFSVKSLDTQERPSHADRSGTFELFNSGVPWQRWVIAKALSIGCYMKCHSSNSSWNEKKKQ